VTRALRASRLRGSPPLWGCALVVLFSGATARAADDEAPSSTDALPSTALLFESTARARKLVGGTVEGQLGAAALELLRLVDEGQLALARSDTAHFERIRVELRAQLRLLDALESRAEAAERVEQAGRALAQAEREWQVLQTSEAAGATPTSPRPEP
jgi:hypothetical protein